jgi:hypothetical protein
MRLLKLTLVIASVVALESAAVAQGRPDPAEIKAAMQKLGFLVGSWVGDASVTQGPGKPINVRQTEEVVYKLDGLVLLVEGTGRDDSGQVVFDALATVAFDPASKTYRIRAYRDGHYIDTELKLNEGGFEWGFQAGPVTVRNRMSLQGGKWSETTDAIMGDGRQYRTMQMLLDRK